jgi:hypothetical protein
MSLSIVMFLLEKEYAATLLTAGLVSINRSGDVWCPKCDKWNAFLDNSNIPNYDTVKWSTNSIEVMFTQLNQLLWWETRER